MDNRMLVSCSVFGLVYEYAVVFILRIPETGF